MSARRSNSLMPNRHATVDEARSPDGASGQRLFRAVPISSAQLQKASGFRGFSIFSPSDTFYILPQNSGLFHDMTGG
jgi:hypothetical protein